MRHGRRGSKRQCGITARRAPPRPLLRPGVSPAPPPGRTARPAVAAAAAPPAAPPQQAACPGALQARVRAGRIGPEEGRADSATKGTTKGREVRCGPDSATCAHRVLIPVSAVPQLLCPPSLPAPSPAEALAPAHLSPPPPGSAARWPPPGAPGRRCARSQAATAAAAAPAGGLMRRGKDGPGQGCHGSGHVTYAVLCCHGQVPAQRTYGCLGKPNRLLRRAACNCNCMPPAPSSPLCPRAALPAAGRPRWLHRSAPALTAAPRPQSTAPARRGDAAAPDTECLGGERRDKATRRQQ